MTSPFSIVKIRVAAVVSHGSELALILRVSGGVEQYTLPGGNVKDAEPRHAALRRELQEELNLHLGPQVEPPLLAVQDQMLNRPGPTPPPRKIHMIYHVVIDDSARARIATVEYDDLGTGQIVWRTRKAAAGLHLYPAAGPLLAAWDEHHRGAPMSLPDLTDGNFSWR